MPDLYKGNMQDFVDKVSQYVRDKYSMTAILGKRTRYAGSNRREPFPGEALSVHSLLMLFMNRHLPTVEEVFDREDFEDQVYEIINKFLEEKPYNPRHIKDVSKDLNYPDYDNVREKLKDMAVSEPRKIVGDWGKWD